MSFLLQLLTMSIWSGIAFADWSNTISNALPDSIFADTTVYSTDEIDQAPIPVVIPTPSYPIPSKRLGQSGKVMLQAIVGADGQVRKTEIVEGVSSLLDSAATAAMRKSVFKPALKDNWPVSTWVTVPIAFRLDHEDSLRISDDPFPRATPLSTPAPEYPQALREEGTKGEVVIWAFVNANGAVSDILVEESTHPAFTEATLAAVRLWKYEPPVDDRTRHWTTTWLRIPIKFKP